MTKWYRVGSTWDTEIEEIEVTRFTDSSVWTKRESDGKEERSNRVSEWRCYFPTLAEAEEHIRRRLQSKIASLRSDLEKEEKKLVGFEAAVTNKTTIKVPKQYRGPLRLN